MGFRHHFNLSVRSVGCRTRMDVSKSLIPAHIRAKFLLLEMQVLFRKNPKIIHASKN